MGQSRKQSKASPAEISQGGVSSVSEATVGLPIGLPSLPRATLLKRVKL